MAVLVMFYLPDLNKLKSFLVTKLRPEYTQLEQVHLEIEQLRQQQVEIG